MLHDIIAKRLGNSPQGGRAAIDKSESCRLLAIIKLREKTCKTNLEAIDAQLIVELDKQLDTYYHFDSDEVWKQAEEIASKAIDEAQAMVVARCKELGIPDRFAPSIRGGWSGAGEQAINERRTELRGIGRRQVDAMVKTGKAQMELTSLEAQTAIMEIGFSDEAKKILDALPTPEQLMPALQLGELEKLLDGSSYRERLNYRSDGREPLKVCWFPTISFYLTNYYVNSTVNEVR